MWINLGQLSPYTFGRQTACHSVIAGGRERAKQALGARFNIMDYHEAVLNCRRVPLDILEGVIDGYAQTKA